MNWLKAATDLINGGYPVPTEDPYELAEILKSINSNDEDEEVAAPSPPKQQ